MMQRSRNSIVVGILTLVCVSAALSAATQPVLPKSSGKPVSKAMTKGISTAFQIPECLYSSFYKAELGPKGKRIQLLPAATAFSKKVREDIAKTTKPIFFIWSHQKTADYPALRDPRVQELLNKEFYVVRVAGKCGFYYLTDKHYDTELWPETMYRVDDRELCFYREWCGDLSADILLAELQEVADQMLARGYYSDTYKGEDAKIVPFFEDALATAKQRNCPIVLSLTDYSYPFCGTFVRNVLHSARVMQYMAKNAVFCWMEADLEGKEFMERARIFDRYGSLVVSPKGIISSVYTGGDTATEFLNYLKKAVPSAVKTVSGTNLSGLASRWMPGWGHDFQKAVKNAKTSGKKIYLFVDDHSPEAYRAKYGDSGFIHPAMAKMLRGYERVQIEPSADNPLGRLFGLSSAPMAAVLDTKMNMYTYDDFIKYSGASNLTYADKIDTYSQDAEWLRRLQCKPSTGEAIIPKDPNIDNENRKDDNWVTSSVYQLLIRHMIGRYQTKQAHQLLLGYIEFMKSRKQHPDLAIEYAAQICRQYTNKKQHDLAISAGELAASLLVDNSDARDKLLVSYYLGKAYTMAGKRADRSRELLERASTIANREYNNYYRLGTSARILLARMDKKVSKKAVAPAK